jgi:hypothetical protein
MVSLPANMGPLLPAVHRIQDAIPQATVTTFIKVF